MNSIRSKKTRTGCKRNRKIYGGNLGYGYNFGQAVAPGAPYASEVVRYESCGSAVKPGLLPEQPGQGLPGMRGGRYTTTFGVEGPAGIAVAYHPSIACDSAQPNPLNLMSGTDRVTAPPPQAMLPGPGVPYAAKGGRRVRKTRKRKGKQSGGVGGIDSQFLIVPRAGYTFVPSDSAGGASGSLADGKTPFALNVPYANTPMANPACLKTGGRRRGRKSRKSRKNSKNRKSRKGNRK